MLSDANDLGARRLSGRDLVRVLLGLGAAPGLSAAFREGVDRCLSEVARVLEILGDVEELRDFACVCLGRG